MVDKATMRQSTPRPWHTEICGGCGSIELLADAKVMDSNYSGDSTTDDHNILDVHFISGSYGGKVRKASDAALIVEAVNQHDTLLELVREFLPHVTMIPATTGHHCRKCAQNQKLLDRARAVLEPQEAPDGR